MNLKFSRKIIRSLILIALFLPVAIHSQDIGYARQILEDLCSPEMHGRGYVHEGDRIAARYISDQFAKLNLKQFDRDYFQEYFVDVNTFPDKMTVEINQQKLIAGEDFLVKSCSPTLKGKFKAIYLEPSELDDKEKLADLFFRSNKALVIDESLFSDEIHAEIVTEIIEMVKYAEDVTIPCLIQIKDSKLTWSGATDQCQTPIIEIRKEKISSRIKKIELDIEAKQLNKYQTQNVIGYHVGTVYPDSFFIISAHYDHLGRMGSETYFPGANDDASGVALMLDLARHYESHPPPYSVAFMAFGAEEIGILGSEYYTSNPYFDLDRIKFMVNVDIVGTGDEGITVVNGAVFTEAFATLKEINEQQELLVKVKKRGRARNSDHYHFTEQGVPAFFIYTMGGIKAYHDIYDRPETLPLTEYEDVFTLITEFISNY